MNIRPGRIYGTNHRGHPCAVMVRKVYRRKWVNVVRFVKSREEWAEPETMLKNDLYELPAGNPELRVALRYKTRINRPLTLDEHQEPY